MSKRKITVTWPNGSSLTGHLIDGENGGINLAFGPDGQWAIVYKVPAGDENFPEGIFKGFHDATIQFHEPTQFGAVIMASKDGASGSHFWVRTSAPGAPGVWTNEFGETAMWDEFDQPSVTVHADGLT